MNNKAQNIIDCLNELSERFKIPLRIVETGTIRSLEPDYIDGDGHSTFYICEWLRDHPVKNTIKNYGIFVSVDLDTKLCENYLIEHDLYKYVDLYENNSIIILPIIGKPIHFVYLDSDNDPELILEEFKIVWKKVVKGGIVIVDDCDLENPILNKGDLLIPYLQYHEIKFEFLSNTNQIKIMK